MKTIGLILVAIGIVVFIHAAWEPVLIVAGVILAAIIGAAAPKVEAAKAKRPPHVNPKNVRFR